MNSETPKPLGDTLGQAAGVVHHVWANVRARLESVVAQGESLSERVDVALHSAGDEVEQRVRANRARLFAWAGAPDSQMLDAVAERLATLEARLEQLDRSLETLETPNPEESEWREAHST